MINERIEIVERVCHCGYCRFCKDSNGTKYWQVYLDGKPVCAGETREEALEEYDDLCERESERGSPYDIEMSGRMD